MAGLLQLLQQQRRDETGDTSIKTERDEWRLLAHSSLNRAYGDDEPDYDDVPAITPILNHE